MPVMARWYRGALILLGAGPVGCTIILGDDFEIVPGAGGGEGGTPSTTSSNMGGQGGMIDCTPNEVSCLDDTTVLDCDAEGMSSTEACTGPTPACFEGDCVPCLDGAVRCADDVTQTCENNTWVNGDTCTIGCDAGACLTVTDISAGTAHSCAVLSNGTVRCWGYTNLDLLFLCDVNDPAEAQSFTPVPTEVPGLDDAVLIGSGNAHNCVVTTADTLACWGWNGLGRLGTGSVMNEPLPVAVTLPAAVSALTVATLHTCVALADGSMHCWGLNEEGQLGNGEIDDPLFYNAPQQVQNLGLPAVQLDSGNGNTCMRDSGKNAACWGDGSQNQLGFGQGDSGTPVSIGGDGVDEIRVGSRHTCYREGGAVTCIGSNNNGQIGNGSINPLTAAFQVFSADIARLDLAGNNSCAIDATDRLYCWGRNVEGQVGVGSSGSNDYVTTPTIIGAAGTVKDLALGYQHACALTTDDRVLCWGANNHGQVGIGVESPVVDTPTEVVW